MTHEQVDSKSVNKRKEKFNEQNNETQKKKQNKTKFYVGCNYKGLLNVATKDVRCSFKHK